MQMATIKGRIDRIPARWLLIAGAMVILASTFGIGAVVAFAPGSNDSSGPGFVTNKFSQLTDDAENIRVKCPECGVVESRREIVQLDKDGVHDMADQTRSRRNTMSARSYEVTLRMKDGRSHQFMATNPENWRLGERVILISGTTKSNN